MPHHEVDHDRAYIWLKLTILHPLTYFRNGHEDKLGDLVVSGCGDYVDRHLQVVDVQHVRVEQVGARIPIREREDADGRAGRRAAEGLGEGGLLGGLGEDAGRGGVGGLDAAGDGAVELVGVGEEGGAAAGDPDAGDGVAAAGLVLVLLLSLARVARHVGAAGGDAKEGGCEALDVDEAVPRTEDSEGFAVAAVDGVEDVGGGDGGVDGLLEGVVDVFDGGRLLGGIIIV